MLGRTDVPSARRPTGGPPSPGLTSADETLIVYSLLAHAAVLPLLERLQPEGVGVDCFKLFRLQWERNEEYYRHMITKNNLILVYYNYLYFLLCVGKSERSSLSEEKLNVEIALFDCFFL